MRRNDRRSREALVSIDWFLDKHPRKNLAGVKEEWDD
jgi:hypothetical protein